MNASAALEHFPSTRWLSWHALAVVWLKNLFECCRLMQWNSYTLTHFRARKESGKKFWKYFHRALCASLDAFRRSRWLFDGLQLYKRMRSSNRFANAKYSKAKTHISCWRCTNCESHLPPTLPLSKCTHTQNCTNKIRLIKTCTGWQPTK